MNDEKQIFRSQMALVSNAGKIKDKAYAIYKEYSEIRGETPEDRRKSQARRLAFRVFLWVLLPTILSAIYYLTWAADMYESESRYTIRSAEGASLVLDSLVGSLPGSSADKDAMAVREYILSRDVLSRLDKEHGYLKHYKSDELDVFSRLSSDASFEDGYDYYLSIVDVTYDYQSGVAILKLQARNAEKAKLFSEAILAYGEEMVNDLSRRAQLDQMELARKEVAEGEDRLARARGVILKIQREDEEINPTESATAISSIRNELELELSRAKAELGEVKTFMQPGSHKVVSLQQRIESLQGQISEENKRLVDPEKDNLSMTIAKFEPYELEKEFAQKAYESALASLEIARTEASKKNIYLAIISKPSSPDEPTHPERMLNIMMVFIACFFIWGLSSLIVAVVREHANI